MRAITPQLQTAYYVLFPHLKFVKEGSILPIIYTQAGCRPQDRRLNGPLGGPEVGRKGTTTIRLDVSARSVCVPITHRQAGRGA